uniref:Integrase catalytic domain-containing protein n=1 Tax=Tanacetum cinerariifolium TaxID=118510 RepID=A0A6L2J9B1_TANCI|nr:hypothetical protein [Tanacetum cinerariifolium]
MSAMGELNFFLGLQVLQKEDGIFLSQDKYIGDILKKFGFSDVRSSNTPMDKENPWGKDGLGKDIELHLYRSMIGSLMYLTASRPDIMFAVCACARHQVTPKECHLHAVKRIFRYLKGHPKLGLWYPKASSFDLVAYSDSDYGGASQDRKSTTGGSQFLGRRESNIRLLVKPIVIDDFSRFTWAFFLKTKDETSGILKNFITEIENIKDLKVKIIRCDNVGEFRNKEMNDFCLRKGIKREFSNARTPQQNEVAKRRIRTLIEAARTMLADAKLPVTFWAEAINTACYVQNRVLVVVGTSSTNFLGTKDAASQHMKNDVSSLRYIALPNWFHEAHLETSTSNAQDACNADAPESMEYAIPTVSSPVPTACLDDSSEPSSDTRLISKRVTSQDDTPSLDNILTLSNSLSDGCKKCLSLWYYDEKVYVMQHPGFQDLEFPSRVYKVEKAMYGLHQAPRAWHRGDFILVQVYVDDIIFGSSNPQLCREFKALMHKKFQMSAMGELNFFLGLQVLQKKDDIFLSQDKYVGQILKNLDTQMSDQLILPWTRRILREKTELVKMHQVTPKECHMHAVKRIFRYLKGHPKLGLWYPKESPFDLVAYSDSDYGGATQDRKLTTGGCQFLGRRLISWHCKKQIIMATSTTKAEYVAAASGCGQDKQAMRGSVLGNHIIYTTIIVDFVEASHIRYALTINPTVYVSHIRQFWSTVRIEITDEGTKILATVDGKLRTISESLIRRNLKLNDEARISSLPDAKLFEILALMGYNILPN